MNNSNDIKTRVFGQCGQIISKTDGNIIVVDFGELIERLLLFEKYIIRSFRLQEIPHFIQAFGFDATLELLNSSAIEIHSDIIPVASMPLKTKKMGKFSFKVITLEFNHAFVMDMDQNRQKLNLPQNKLLTLEETLAKKVTHYPVDSYQDIQSQFTNDLRNNVPHIRTALAISLNKKIGNDIKPDRIEIEIDAPSMEDVRVDTNLRDLCQLSNEDIDDHICSALIAIGGLNERILQMKTYNSLTGFNDSELPIFEEKLRFLEQSHSPESQEKRLNRILEIKKFPDLGEAAANGQLDLLKLLEIRQMREIKEFRDWLLSIDSMSDEDLEERIAGLKNVISVLYNSKTGKVIRWLASNAAGLIPPPIGLAAGPAVSVLDSFLSNKVFPENGALTFVNNAFPTIFESS